MPKATRQRPQRRGRFMDPIIAPPAPNATPALKMRYYAKPCDACGKLYPRKSLTHGSPLCQGCFSLTTATSQPPASALQPPIIVDTSAMEFEQQAAALKHAVDMRIAAVWADGAAASPADMEEVLHLHAPHLEKTLNALDILFQKS
ncbi:hypothetical protein FB451DRAFT_1557337 [Mycena latifolia]|nr:hypothetical protein FB451DRAFT_1557337 [Mycena latifolia]